ncbi:MAG TPA: VanZ family protein, partial [Blastocatellia bacterium]|nr:VanZ family protein [Blastocatellia bacterium]
MKRSEVGSLKQALLLAFSQVLIILYGTLLPLQFVLTRTRAFEWHLGLIRQTGDWIINILFFIPLGFSLMWTAKLLGKRAGASLVVITLSGAALSFTVEYLQLFLPTRGSCLRDIIANTLGATVGAYLFERSGGRVLHYFALLREFCGRINPVVWLCLLICYLALVISGAGYLKHQAKLSNWSDGYFLTLGNEHRGGRPWLGSVTEFHIWNRALAPAETAELLKVQTPVLDQSLVASYMLTKSLQDRSMNLPNLGWRGDARAIASGGLQLNNQRWLESEAVAATLSQKIKETNQFTISLNLKFGSAIQYGPARILSFSNDSGRRNFTIGQIGTDLVLRLRTPLTGENGRYPQLVIEDVFIDNNPHQIVITYDSRLLRLYIDDVTRSYHYDFGPEATIFRRFASIEEEIF